MKKILLIDDNYHAPESGAFLNILERKLLAENGYDVYTFSCPSDIPHNASKNDFYFPPPKTRLRRKIGKFLGDSNLRKRLKDAIYHIAPDLIHCHLISQYPADVYCVLDKKTPIIQTLHGPNLFCATSWGCRQNSVPCEMGIGLKCYVRGCMSFSGTLLYSYLHSRTWNNLLAKVKVFHCPSRNIMNTALRLGIQNVAHISLGINERFLNVDRERPPGEPTVIFVGSLEKCKGVDVLVEAMRIVIKTIPTAKLRIAGVGPLQSELQSKLALHNLESCVSLLGHVSHETLTNEYCRADVLVVPSIWQEQFGLVGPEAMACGLPCIGSDIGGISEWLHHGEWGLLVPPGNKGHLASAIIKYLSNREFAYKQGVIGQNYAREHFSPLRYGKNLLGLIESLL